MMSWLGGASAVAGFGALATTVALQIGDHPHGLRVLEGDRFEMASTGDRLRLHDWDTPEIDTIQACQRTIGMAARREAHKRLSLAEEVVVEASGVGLFGRRLVMVLVDGEDLGALLAGKGLARPYEPGAVGKGWC